MNIATRNKIHEKLGQIEELCGEVTEAVQVERTDAGRYEEIQEHVKKLGACFDEAFFELHKQTEKQFESLRNEMRAGLEAANNRLDTVAADLSLANSRLLALVNMQNPRKPGPRKTRRNAGFRNRPNNNPGPRGTIKH